MLKDKVALVTGGSSGIGLAVAQVWARESAKVMVSDANTEQGEKAAANLCAQGHDALFVQADVGDPGAGLRLLPAAITRSMAAAWHGEPAS